MAESTQLRWCTTGQIKPKQSQRQLMKQEPLQQMTPNSQNNTQILNLMICMMKCSELKCTDAGNLFCMKT